MKLISIISLVTITTAQNIDDTRRKNKKQNKTPQDRNDAHIESIKNFLNDGSQLANLVTNGVLNKIQREQKISPGLLKNLVNSQWIEKQSAENRLLCPNNKCDVPLSIQGIFSYGCWCNFGNALTTGKGDPVNEHDTICMEMQQCLRCVKLDDPTCNPVTTEFDIGNSMDIDSESLDMKCELLNAGDKCKIRSCMCEQNLVAKIIQAVWDGVVYDPQYKHEVFDPIGTCYNRNVQGGDNDNNNNGNGNGSQSVTSDNNGGNTGGNGGPEVIIDPSALACCGNYPDRVPYKMSAKDCCSGVTLFNPFEGICCENDGSIISLGQFC